MINFKKVTAVLSSALMIGMTAGMAAAANYPAPFVSGGTANVAIVYGTNAQASDAVAAAAIKEDLATGVSGTSGTGETASASGDNVQLTKSSNRINLNDGIDDIWTASITKSNLPTLLADGVYANDENTEYSYTQKVVFSDGVDFAHFADSDYEDKKSSLGFKLSNSQFVLNYTLDWTTNPESDVTGGDLVDIETTSITMLGREYYFLDFDNVTSDVTLLDAASSTILSEGETSTVTVGDKTYTVGMNFIGSSSVKLDIDGQVTSSLSAGGTQKLDDGSYVGIKEINVQDYAGGTKNVEFSIGTGKLEIKGGGTASATGLTNCGSSTSIELNDLAVDDITGCIKRANSVSGKEKLDKIVLTWKTDEEVFLTPTNDLLMPGFEALKFTMGDIVFPKMEETLVEYSGDDVFEIKTTIKDGAITLPILFLGSAGNFTYIGKASDEQLETGNGSVYLEYNATSGRNEGFIASWNNSKESESYYLSAKVSRDSSGAKTNRTTIKNKLTGEEVCKDLQATDVCTLGNVELTVNNVNYAATDRNVSLQINSGGSFNRLYTVEGLSIWLPYKTNPSANGTTRGEINMGDGTAANCNGTDTLDGNNCEDFTLWFQEEDKDETLGAGTVFNMTLKTSSTSSVKASVTNLRGPNSVALETERSSKIYDGWVYDELATNIQWDKTNTDQYSAKVIYHGDEVFADVFLSAPGSVVTSGSAGVGEIGDVVVLDSETSMFTKNLVVVGGSCINTVAANLVGASHCTSDWETATGIGAGKYLIQSYDNPYATGTEIALLVAGYNAADTTNAQAALVASTFDMTVGKKYTGTTATNAVAT